VAWLESPDGLSATARISSSLTAVKQILGGETELYAEMRRKCHVRDPKKFAIARAQSPAREERALPRLQQLVRIDVDCDGDVFGEWQFVERFTDEPAQAHDGLAADQNVKTELAL
jgi:hypothetical protein